MPQCCCNDSPFTGDQVLCRVSERGMQGLDVSDLPLINKVAGPQEDWPAGVIRIKRPPDVTGVWADLMMCKKGSRRHGPLMSRSGCCLSPV